MDLHLRDKVVLVAGSSRGIGKAIARGFLQEHARVVLTGRDPKHVEATRREFETEFGPKSIMTFVGDLTDPAAIQTCAAEIGKKWDAMHVLIANIGGGNSPPGWQVSAEELTRVFNLNFFGTVRLINEFLPHLLRQKGGTVVLVSSIAGVEATQAPLAYGSAKSALNLYGKNLARQVAADGVRVNVVAPGNIFFPGGTWEQHAARAPDKVSGYLAAEVPMARFGRPEEIADFVVFLCSERASLVTGMCAVLDGGQTRSV